MDLPGRDEAGVLTAFLHEVLRDRRAGGLRSLEEYRARFPGFEHVVEREYRTLAGDAPEVDGDESSVATPRVPPGAGRRSVEEGGDSSARYAGAHEVARGGMGRILGVFDRTLERTLAMKVLRGDAQDDRSQLGRFVREAKITARLDHPGIVPVHDLGFDDDGRVYFTMPLVRGHDFRTVIGLVHRGAEGWTRPRALEVVLRVCDAVAYAHSRGVVHRDLKPANVMVGEFGETYVMDWGLARIVDESADDPVGGGAEREPDATPEWTLAGDIVGTPAYMAPEQARGDVRAVGPLSDLYSIGAILYHLLTGQAPYSSSGSSEEVLATVTSRPPPSLADTAPDVPAELVAICERAMARDPARRYASVRELADDLRAFLEMRVVRAYETGAFAELRKWVRRNRGVAAASVAAVVALVVGLIVSVRQTQRAEAEAQRADTHLRTAFGGVERMLERARHSPLEVGSTSSSEPVIRAALDITNAFLSARGDDPTVRGSVVRAWSRVATLQHMLGEYDDAEASAERATRMLREMLGDEPGRVDYLEVLASLHNTAGRLHTSRGRPEKALESFEALHVVLDELSQSAPQRADYRWWRCIAVGNAALALHALGRAVEALERNREAIDVCASLVREDPGPIEYRAWLATLHVNLAFELRGLSRYAESIEHSQKALTDVDAMLADQPGDRDVRRLRGNALNGLGLALQLTGDLEGAAETFTRAIPVRRQLVEDFPELPLLRSDLSGALNNLGRLRRQQGRLVDARPLVEEAWGESTRTLAILPDDVQVLRYAANQLELLGLVLLELGDHRGADARARELAELPIDDERLRLVAAGLLAQAGAAAGSDDSLASDDRNACVASSCARSLDVLESLVADGFADRDALWRAGFDALRTEPRFQSLVDGLARGRWSADDVDSAEPVEALWVTGRSAEELAGLRDQGYRITDVELEAEQPARFAAALVRNADRYRKRWWWLPDAGGDEVVRHIQEHRSRLVDVVAWRAAGELRLAAVLVANEGADEAGWWWFGSLTNADVAATAERYGARPIAIAPHRDADGRSRRWAVVMVQNVASRRRAWKFVRDVAPSAIEAELEAGWRPWMIDHESLDDEMHAVFVRGSPTAAQTVLAVTADEVQRSVAAGRRVVAFTSYVRDGRRLYDVVSVPNAR